MFAAYLRSHWSDLRAGLLDVLSKFEDGDLVFRPFESSWTVAEFMLHIAHEELGEVQCAITRELAGWPEAYSPSDYRSIDSIRNLYAQVHERTIALIEQLDDEGLAREVETPWGTKSAMQVLLGHVIEHETHHRAELSLILGMLGRQGIDA